VWYIVVFDMPAVVCMLRGVNLGNRRRLSMEALKATFEALGLRDVSTYVQSGNIVFRTEARDMARLAKRIGQAFETTFGFHSDVLLRTAAEMRDAIARNPFEGRGIEPAKLLVWFLEKEPTPESREKFSRVPIAPEEARLHVRELYIHYPNGMGRSKLPMAQIERAISTTGTGRNWNTVEKLTEMAEKLR
jgi:uncharacterized protein (DUF1697 family)